MRRWNSWLEKKSASLTRFWLFAYLAIRGMTLPAVVGGTTDSFICTKVWSRFASSVAFARVAVVWPPLTICKFVTLPRRMPFSVVVISAAEAVVAMPLLYANNIVGSVVMV